MIDALKWWGAVLLVVLIGFCTTGCTYVTVNVDHFETRVETCK
jgi:hypothetical protein